MVSAPLCLESQKYTYRKHGDPEVVRRGGRYPHGYRDGAVSRRLTPHSPRTRERVGRELHSIAVVRWRIECYSLFMPNKPASAAEATSLVKRRSFKSAWFHKAASKRGILDMELCGAIEEVMLGQGDDLGGGVWKKRLNKNRDRSIIVGKGGLNWFFVFLFQKKDRGNIDASEVAAFKLLASSYAGLTAGQIAALLNSQEMVEICNNEID